MMVMDKHRLLEAYYATHRDILRVILGIVALGAFAYTLGLW